MGTPDGGRKKDSQNREPEPGTGNSDSEWSLCSRFPRPRLRRAAYPFPVPAYLVVPFRVENRPV